MYCQSRSEWAWELWQWKSDFTFYFTPEQDPHQQIQFSIISSTPIFEGVLPHCRRYIWHIIGPTDRALIFWCLLSLVYYVRHSSLVRYKTNGKEMRVGRLCCINLLIQETLLWKSAFKILDLKQCLKNDCQDCMKCIK